MFLLYLDESGNPHAHPNEPSTFVVLGVAVHESTWYALEQRVAKVRQRFDLKPGTELHAKWILRRYAEQERIKGFEALSFTARQEAIRNMRKRKLDSYESDAKRRSKANEFRHTEPFAHLTRNERNALVDAALKVVGSYRRHKLYLFGEAINKDTLGDGIDPLEECFDQIVSRFERFLHERRYDNCGLLVVDHNYTQARKLPKLIKDFQSSGTRWSSIERVIEAPFFVDSAKCSGVQLADLCGYALRRNIDYGETHRLKKFFNKFYRQRGKLVGLRHFTQRGCPCMTCRKRGHD